jgi:uncharacterized protein YodC (DUF2158 family)
MHGQRDKTPPTCGCAAPSYTHPWLDRDNRGMQRHQAPWHEGERVQQARDGAVMQVVIAGRTHTYCEWYVGGRKQHSVFRNEQLQPVRTDRDRGRFERPH